jgi:hypothetical protein
MNDPLYQYLWLKELASLSGITFELKTHKPNRQTFDRLYFWQWGDRKASIAENLEQSIENCFLYVLYSIQNRWGKLVK